MDNRLRIGKSYNYFDDGKIKRSRLYNVVLSSIIPFDYIDDETLALWKDEVSECDWLYKNKTDYFVKGVLEKSPLSYEKVTFVRTIDDEWFSMGWFSGRLDVDGKLTEIMNKYENK